LLQVNFFLYMNRIFSRFDDVLKKITTVALPNHVGSLLNKREYHYVLSLNFTPRMEALLSQWLYLTLFHGIFWYCN
jgi:hypothetical protein